MDEDPRVAIVGAGGYGRTALDVLLAAGFEEWILGFYDDAHKALPEKIRGFPILGDIAMLKSMLSIETVQVIVRDHGQQRPVEGLELDKGFGWAVYGSDAPDGVRFAGGCGW